MEMKYALIVNGIVTNVIWLHPVNSHEFPNAIPIGMFAVDIGDEYIDGKFYRDGMQVGAGNHFENSYSIPDNIYNDIIDDYTLSLIEGGVL